jgi:hypothetical protein
MLFVSQTTLARKRKKGRVLDRPDRRKMDRIVCIVFIITLCNSLIHFPHISAIALTTSLKMFASITPSPFFAVANANDDARHATAGWMRVIGRNNKSEPIIDWNTGTPSPAAPVVDTTGLLVAMADVDAVEMAADPVKKAALVVVKDGSYFNGSNAPETETSVVSIWY